jgi:hypothetical protein
MQNTMPRVEVYYAQCPNCFAWDLFPKDSLVFKAGVKVPFTSPRCPACGEGPVTVHKLEHGLAPQDDVEKGFSIAQPEAA